jgi:hypothetical protein
MFANAALSSVRPFHDGLGYKEQEPILKRGGAVTDFDEASRMVDTFASCGATSFVVTKTELEWPGPQESQMGQGLLARRLA